MTAQRTANQTYAWHAFGFIQESLGEEEGGSLIHRSTHTIQGKDYVSMSADDKTAKENGVRALLETKNISHLLSLRDEIRHNENYLKHHELSVYIQFVRILRTTVSSVDSEGAIPSISIAFVMSVVTEALNRLEAGARRSTTTAL